MAVLPKPPQGLSPEIMRWASELIRVLESELSRPKRLGEDYHILGTSAVPVTVTVNVTAPNLSTTSQALAKLLLALKKSGTLDVKEF